MPVRRVIREMSADQPIEHAATLEDVRAEVLTPNRLQSPTRQPRTCRTPASSNGSASAPPRDVFESGSVLNGLIGDISRITRLTGMTSE